MSQQLFIPHPAIMGQRLKQLMQEHGTTQDELAQRTQLNQSAISRLVNGRTKPRFDHLMVIARYFRISLQWLGGLNVPREVGEAAAALPTEVPPPKRVRAEARMVSEATLRGLVRQLRQQADELEAACDKIFQNGGELPAVGNPQAPQT